ncbi:acetylornithine deacetylase [Cytobacillus eiseniae]|uniref:Acetylornithine deacetylase n=1 Tax=Cytobacillus eiseniae TaxID=762947 RepID=A0ABS4REV6_9BACI|nr:peptidase [Cytobacillus eiseniae]MBP2241234.1 acetylornithine deacetylase [Cytobacillus eiseniae]
MQEEIKIKNWLQENREKGIRFLQRLVQEGSTRGNESSAQAIIIEKCRKLGLTLDIWEIGENKLLEHPVYRSDRKDFTGNPNVIGVLKGTGGGQSMILNGHIDVVPEGNRKDWHQDPFSGLLEDGKIYGRGSTDMKGGTASLLLAMEAIISLNIQLKGDVIFQSVIEEESGGAGTLATVLRGYRADGAIIPEPTNMKLFPKQQGSMWFRITVKGRSAHGGTRYEGVNAIEKAMLIIKALNELEKMRNAKINDSLYQNIPIPVPINIGKIQSGQWPSSVPDIAVIEGRIGVAPSETMAKVEQELEDCLSQLAKSDEWLRNNQPKIEWFGGRWLPGNLEVDHPLMTTLKTSFEKVKKEKPIIEASPWGTDGGILSTVGNTPVVIFGPGTTEAAHDVNEYISVDAVFIAAEIIALSLLEWCKIDS